MYITLLVIDVLLAFVLIALILLHRGRGADVGVSFGGGASGTVFGAKGATSFLGKVIGCLSAIFLLNSLALAYIANRNFSDQGIIEQVESVPVQTDEFVPDTPPEEDIDTEMERPVPEVPE